MTWLPTKAPLSAPTYTALTPVTITGNALYFPGDFAISPVLGDSTSFYAGSVGQAILIAGWTAIGLANICTSPVKSQFPGVTNESDKTERWLAAQAMFNVIQAKNMLNQYGSVTQGLTFLLNGVKYKGFKVWYTNGYSEVWLINPGYATSTVKLFDEPLPNSIQANPQMSGCTGG